MPVSSGPEAMDARDNELDELNIQSMCVSGSGGVGERVLDPSPSDSVLGASTGQAGESQEEVMESSPTFSPLSGSVLSETPTSGDSCIVGSAGDGSASLNSDSRPLRSRIPVKVTRGGSGELLPHLCPRRKQWLWCKR